jgi:transposase
LTLGQRARIKALKDAGWKYSKIAKDIQCSISTIKYTLNQIKKTVDSEISKKEVENAS